MAETRPLYESFVDLGNEVEVAAALGRRWKCRFVKMPMRYGIDWAVMRGQEIVAVAELKCRKNLSTGYPTLMLSLAKWMHGKQLAKELKVPFVIVVRWEDGIFYCPECEVQYGFGGRSDRQDSQDMEPMVFIDVSKFKKIKGV